jgi:hypothetical protein
VRTQKRLRCRSNYRIPDNPCIDLIQQAKALVTVGRVLIAIAAIVFGVQHFLHPLALPGVPLVKQMPRGSPFPP